MQVDDAMDIMLNIKTVTTYKLSKVKTKPLIYYLSVGTLESFCGRFFLGVYIFAFALTSLLVARCLFTIKTSRLVNLIPLFLYLFQFFVHSITNSNNYCFFFVDAHSRSSLRRGLCYANIINQLINL